MTEFEVEDRYDCSVSTLHATVTDAAYLQAKFPAVGFLDVQVVAAEQTHVETRRTVAAALPGFARKVLGETQTITQVEDWAVTPARVTGTFTATAKGTPVKVQGTIGIEPAGDGCVLRIRGSVEARLPLVGGKIAALVADQARETLAKECTFTQEWLAKH